MNISNITILKYKSFVVELARFAIRKSKIDSAIEIKDVIQEGLIELYNCLKEYSGDNGFEKFSRNRIFGKMCNFIMQTRFTKWNEGYTKIKLEDNILSNYDLENLVNNKCKLDLVCDKLYDSDNGGRITNEEKSLFLKHIFLGKPRIDLTKSNLIVIKKVREYLMEE